MFAEIRIVEGGARACGSNCLSRRLATSLLMYAFMVTVLSCSWYLRVLSGLEDSMRCRVNETLRVTTPIFSTL